MKEKKIFLCEECGFDAPKWSGQCPSCGMWNTMKEYKAPAVARKRRAGGTFLNEERPMLLSEVAAEGEEGRLSTGIGEFDRVLGGGAVRGSVVLIGGAPGIGKSTLLLQTCRTVCTQAKVLYVSGEESTTQIKSRAERIGISGDRLYVLAETDIEAAIQAAEQLAPDLVIVDSIQTSSMPSAETAPGSVTQVKECALALMHYAKRSGVIVFVVGHVNKDGAIAGPKVLEHMVDCVLYFEGERHAAYRILRAEKNRFGSTHELGVFEMGEEGLRPVENPSEALLSGRPVMTPGSCVACTIEGSRPVLAEIQALVNRSSFAVPRRMAAGMDYNRMALLMAIIEKRAGLLISGYDAYVNVVGGLRLDEPAADLPAALAIASSFRDRPLAEGLAAFGELGLTGELRSVPFPDRRLSEISRLGFSGCILPEQCMKNIKPPEGLRVIPVRTLSEALIEALV